MLGTILIVDDYLPLLRNMAFLLRIAGFDVLTASSGSEALKVLDKRVPDLVISDITMPGMDGYELLQSIRSSACWETLPFIFTSVRYDLDDLLYGLDMGADDYIPKPFDIYDVLDSIQRTVPHLISENTTQKHPIAS
jgi:DNA-binding response OmpR family regulator